MAATIAGARIAPKKAQVQYKKGFDFRIRRGNADIKFGNWVWLVVQYGKGNDKLSGHTEGLFQILHRTTQTFVPQLGDLV